MGHPHTRWHRIQNFPYLHCCTRKEKRKEKERNEEADKLGTEPVECVKEHTILACLDSDSAVVNTKSNCRRTRKVRYRDREQHKSARAKVPALTAADFQQRRGHSLEGGRCGLLFTLTNRNGDQITRYQSQSGVAKNPDPRQPTIYPMPRIQLLTGFRCTRSTEP